MELRWQHKTFDALTTSELYAIMQLRNEVFVVEQNCVYQDADNKDAMSIHVTGWQDNSLSAYCRIIPPGIVYQEASIGRVVTSPNHRKYGYGRKLMEHAISLTFSHFNCTKITISAQLYLKNFYTSLGFVKKGDPYIEDSILHVRMELAT